MSTSIEVVQKDDKALTVYLTEKDSGDPIPIDLAASVYFTLGDIDTMTALFTEIEITDTTGWASGQVEVEIPSAVTELWTPGRYSYVLQIRTITAGKQRTHQNTVVLQVFQIYE